MKKINLAIALLIFLGATATSQEQTPQLLFSAAHCLAVKDFLPARATKLSFGYLLDEKSYPGVKEVYLVNYSAPTRSNGLVFAVVLTEHAGRQNFNIQNNASFVLSKDDLEGVFCRSPTWWYVDAAASRVGHQANRNPAEVCNSCQGLTRHAASH
jgi:hypothetical protein